MFTFKTINNIDAAMPIEEIIAVTEVVDNREVKCHVWNRGDNTPFNCIEPYEKVKKRFESMLKHNNQQIVHGKRFMVACPHCDKAFRITVEQSE